MSEGVSEKVSEHGRMCACEGARECVYVCVHVYDSGFDNTIYKSSTWSDTTTAVAPAYPPPGGGSGCQSCATVVSDGSHPTALPIRRCRQLHIASAGTGRKMTV